MLEASVQRKRDEQRALLAAHGLYPRENANNFSEQEEARLRKALATLGADGGVPGDPERNVRAAFLLGNKQKIHAAMELHKLGLMNLNGHGTDGDALAHFIARTQCKLAQADFGSTLAATLTIAERFTILKEAGADLTCRNRNN